MLKRICLILIMMVVCCLTTGMAVTAHVSAVDVLGECSGNSSSPQCGPCSNTDKAAGTQVQLCNDNQNGSKTDPLVGPGGLITTAVNLLSIIVGVAAIVVIVIAGLRTVISAGDPQSVSNARRGLIYALIGLGVAAVAQALVTFVLNKV